MRRPLLLATLALLACQEDPSEDVLSCDLDDDCPSGYVACIEGECLTAEEVAALPDAGPRDRAGDHDPPPPPTVPAADDLVIADPMRVGGQGVPGARVRLFLNAACQGAAAATAPVQADGAFELVFPLPDAADWTFTADQVDGDGVASACTASRRVLRAVDCGEPPADGRRRWIGLDADWERPENWLPRGVPDAEAVIEVCLVAPTPLRLDRPRRVAGLLLEVGARLDLGGHALTVSTLARVSGELVGGLLTAVGQARLTGSFPALRVEGEAELDGAVDVAGDVEIISGGTLNVGPHTLDVAGALRSTRAGQGDGLTLLEPASLVKVGGPLRLDRLPAAGVQEGDKVLLAGALRALGDVTATGGGLATDGALLHMAADATLDLGDFSTLSDLEIPAAATIRLRGELHLNGHLRLEGGLVPDAIPSADGARPTVHLWGPLPTLGAAANFGIGEAVIHGGVELEAPLNLPRTTLVVAGWATLNVGPHTVSAESIKVWVGEAASTGLVMHDPEGLIQTGDLTINVLSEAELGEPSARLTAGTIELTGQFTQGGDPDVQVRAFSPLIVDEVPGTTVRFVGAGAHRVLIGNFFHNWLGHLSVAEDAVVVLEDSVKIAGEVTLEGPGAVVRQSADLFTKLHRMPPGGSNWQVPVNELWQSAFLLADTRIEGTLRVVEAQHLNLSGSTLSMGGLLRVDGAIFGEGVLALEGGLFAADNAFARVNTAVEMVLSGGAVTLGANNPLGRVTIAAGATVAFDSDVDLDGDLLVEGELTLRGALALSDASTLTLAAGATLVVEGPCPRLRLAQLRRSADALLRDPGGCLLP